MAQPRDREAFEQAVVRGSELLKQGKIDLAQSAFREALALEPDNPRVLALLGLSHFRASAFTEARAIYEKLVDRAPGDASHRLNLGLVYLKLNDAERAIAALETSRALDPSQGRAVSYLGLAYARAGRYAEAYRAFLIAGQNDLATEIESNLSVLERDRIHGQLGRSPQGPLVDPGSGRIAGAAAAAAVPAGPPSAAPPQAAAPAPVPPHASAPVSVPPHAASQQAAPPASVSPHAASQQAAPPASVPPYAAPPASVPPHAASQQAAPPASVPPYAAPPPSVPPHAASQQATSPASVPPYAAPPASAPPQAASPQVASPASIPPPSVPRTVTPRSVPRAAAVTPATGVPRALMEPEAARTPTPHVIPRSRPPGKPRAASQPGIPDASPPAPDTSTVPSPSPAAAAAAPSAVPVAVAPDPPVVARTVTPGGTVRITESTQFVMPRADPIAPAQGLDGPSMISHAVASATPSGIIRLHSRTGGTPPRPLSDLATDDLIRPDEGAEVFEIAPAGALIIRIADRVLSRLDGVHITGGDLSYELAMRRSRGHSTEQAFDYGGSQLHAVTGRGYLIAAPGKHAFAAVSLDDDILYLREDLVFAFESSLRWENGNVPGLRGKLPVVQFRGDGAVALRLTRPLVRVKLPAQGVVFIDAERLAGWIGRVIPRAVVPPPGGPLGAMCVECTGEGVVLIEPAPDDPPAARAEPRPRSAGAAPPAPPAPTAPPEPFDHLDDL